MASPTYRIRHGSVLGVEHARMGINNQDAVQSLEFAVPAWERSFRTGIVSDGCTGIPAFTRSEVGSNLLAVFCLARIQELILGGASIEQIPLPLYHHVTGFLRTLAGMVMPPNVLWKYPDVKFPKGQEYRTSLKANQRFMIDYLTATIVGFVDDGEQLVTFQAGDGTIIINGEPFVVDQNDMPEYPALTIDTPGGGFEVKTYDSASVQRIVLASDGIEKLLEVDELDLPERLFDNPGNPMAMQWLLNRLRKDYGVYMSDDCTVLTMEREEVEDGQPEDQTEGG